MTLIILLSNKDKGVKDLDGVEDINANEGIQWEFEDVYAMAESEVEQSDVVEKVQVELNNIKYDVETIIYLARSVEENEKYDCETYPESVYGLGNIIYELGMDTSIIKSYTLSFDKTDKYLVGAIRPYDISVDEATEQIKEYMKQYGDNEVDYMIYRHNYYIFIVMCKDFKAVYESIVNQLAEIDNLISESVIMQ